MGGVEGNGKVGRRKKEKEGDMAPHPPLIAPTFQSALAFVQICMCASVHVLERGRESYVGKTQKMMKAVCTDSRPHKKCTSVVVKKTCTSTENINKALYVNLRLTVV